MPRSSTIRTGATTGGAPCVLRRRDPGGGLAAGTLVDGIAGATETDLPRTGHMFRFSHPVDYAQAVDRFLAERVDRIPALDGPG